MRTHPSIHSRCPPCTRRRAGCSRSFQGRWSRRRTAGNRLGAAAARATPRCRGRRSSWGVANSASSTTPWPPPSDDYPQLQKVKAGEVLRLTRSAAWKLRTEVDLIVGGELRLDTENVAANYPGVYSLWLKKTTNGWNLLANSEPDIWATMHNPDADVGEIALTVASLPRARRSSSSSSQKRTAAHRSASPGARPSGARTLRRRSVGRSGGVRIRSEDVRSRE